MGVFGWEWPSVLKRAVFLKLFSHEQHVSTNMNTCQRFTADAFQNRVFVFHLSQVLTIGDQQELDITAYGASHRDVALVLMAKVLSMLSSYWKRQQGGLHVVSFARHAVRAPCAMRCVHLKLQRQGAVASVRNEWPSPSQRNETNDSWRLNKSFYWVRSS